MADPAAPRRPDRPINPSTGPLLPRLIKAILLRREFYEAVADDPRATGPAGAIVCIAALARESVGLYELSQDFKGWGLILLLIVVFATLRWLLYATIMYPVARAISAAPLGYARLLRCLGFAETPAVLSLASFMVDDQFYPWVQFVVGAWLLLATIVAVRAATRVSTARAAVIGVMGFAAYLGLGLAVDFVTSASAPPGGGTLTPRGSV
jgi:hypothetical protein